MSTDRKIPDYNEIALRVLDDQGQAEVSELVTEGNYMRVEQILVAHTDRLCDAKELMFSERDSIFDQLGLPLHTVTEMRNSGEYIGIRGILNQESDDWVMVTCREDHIS